MSDDGLQHISKTLHEIMDGLWAARMVRSVDEGRKEYSESVARGSVGTLERLFSRIGCAAYLLANGYGDELSEEEVSDMLNDVDDARQMLTRHRQLLRKRQRRGE